MRSKVALAGAIGAAFVGGLVVATVLAPTRPTSSAIGTPEPVPAAPAPTQSATPRPSPTPPRELVQFLADYVQARQKFSDALSKVGGFDDAKYYGGRQVAALMSSYDFEALPRTPLTRQFIEDALVANQSFQKGTTILWQAYVNRGKSTPDEDARAIALWNDSERQWRTLDDRIEDAMRPYGLSWPGGAGRPTIPR